VVAVDMRTGQPVALGYLDEKDPQAVKKFLEPLVQRLGVSVIVTDGAVLEPGWLVEQSLRWTALLGMAVAKSLDK